MERLTFRFAHAAVVASSSRGGGGIGTDTDAAGVVGGNFGANGGPFRDFGGCLTSEVFGGGPLEGFDEIEQRWEIIAVVSGG